MPTIGTSAKDLGTEDFVDFSDLDQMPRPVGVSGFNFPRRLRKDPVSGRIVLLLKLDEDGDVLDVEVDSSTLPRFNDFVLEEVRQWKFTPPTQGGRPVKAKARLPIPINIS
jgi:TonB family protein